MKEDPFSMMSRRDLEGIVKGRVSAIMRSPVDMPSSGQRIPGKRKKLVEYRYNDLTSLQTR